MSLVSLSQVKGWMRYPNPSQPSPDDTSIQLVIDACTSIVESKVGVVDPKTYTEKYDGGGYQIFLRMVPVLSVDEILESYGPFSYRLDYQDSAGGVIIDPLGGTSDGAAPASPFAYSIDQPSIGQISKRTVGNYPMSFASGEDNIQVTYTAGMATCPPAIQLAVMELASHIWSNSEMRSVALSGTNLMYDAASGQAYSHDTPDGSTRMWYSIPQRVIELLEPEVIKLPVMA